MKRKEAFKINSKELESEFTGCKSGWIKEAWKIGLTPRCDDEILFRGGGGNSRPCKVETILFSGNTKKYETGVLFGVV